MSRENGFNRRILSMLKGLMGAYIITAGLLLLLTVFLYKMDINEKVVAAGIVSIYVLSTLFGGIIVGRHVQTRRFVWGACLGVLYFLLLILVTLLVYRKLNDSSVNVVTTLVLCISGGTIGGMIS